MRLAKILILLLSSMFVTALAQTLPSSPLDPMPTNPDGTPLPNLQGPIHRFPLDGSVVDVVGGTSAELTEGARFVDGYIGRALHFDGTGSVAIPLNIGSRAVLEGSLSSTPYATMTIIAMVRPDPLPTDPDELKSIWPTGYVIGDGDGLIYVGNQQNSGIGYAAFSDGAIISNSDHPASRGAWKPIAITRRYELRQNDAGTDEQHTVLTLFSDGTTSEYAGKSRTGAIGGELILGSISPGSNYKFRGAIDNVLIFNRALTEEQIVQQIGIMRNSSGTAPAVLNPRTLPSGPERVPDDAVQPGEEELFPGDMFDEGEEEQFPGDMFESGEDQQFPGDQFDPVDGDESMPDSVPGLPVGESGDASNFPGSVTGEIFATEMDDLARRERAAETARDRAIPSVGANDVPSNPEHHINKSIIPKDQRSDATPRAGGGAVSRADSDFEAPIENEDDISAITDTQEGRDMLAAVDWRIVGMVSHDNQTLFPGDEFDVTIRVKKDDPANKIPDVKLIINPHARQPNVVLPFRVMTSEQTPTAQRDIPATLKVPDKIEFAEGSDVFIWHPTARLADDGGRELVDNNPDNHRQDLAFQIHRASDEACVDAEVDNKGLRTIGDCLSYARPPEQPDSTTDESERTRDYPYPRVDLNTISMTGWSGDGFPHGMTISDVAMQFDGRATALGFLKIGERWNSPCRIAIDDAWEDGKDGKEPGQAIDKCDGDVRDSIVVRVPQFSGVTAMQVCGATNNFTSRVKGIRLFYRRIQSSGELDPMSQSHRDDAHVNCNTNHWRTPVECPEGHIAAGVTARFFANLFSNKRKRIGLMGLICAKPLPYGEQ